MAIENEALTWDGPIDAQDGQFTILTPGEYSFRVDGFTRGHFPGSTKMQACPMAELSLTCANAHGEQSTVSTRLYLNRKQQWKLTQFFKACNLIPLDAKGETRLPWNRVLGAMGTCKVKNREYDGKTFNEIDSFIVPKAQATSASAAPTTGYAL